MGLALYVHWPFCLAKCPYCDFNSHVRDEIPQARFARALRTELATEAARLGPRPLASIFFGGGTPSLMEPATVAALIDDACRLFPPMPDLEITLEANPTSVELGRLRGFRDAGVNRVSLGVQSLDADALHMLGREHSAPQAVAALEIARAIFPRISFDLIYARPGQSVAAWRAELDQALTLASDHLSLYQLTIEPGTKFEALHRQGLIAMPDQELGAALYEETADVAARHGLLAYEVSNYARPGSESRHNLAYWRYSDYAGIGPGAHGRITLPDADQDGPAIYATRRHRAPEPWADRVERLGHGLTDETRLVAPEPAREMLLMGLRLSEGIDAARFAARTGTALQDAVEPAILEAAIEEDYLRWDGGSLIATSAGRLRLEALLGALVR
ncbi:radical SAM family heme chaperone HemW [Lichenicola sp.]|uniref:radical SAM family heme chaperone HemW n=1 Tax=Lichenicola sp. TaxID=2804529 RepID=UPI003AFFAEBF